MLLKFFSLSLSSINTFELYKLTLSDQAQVTGVRLSDLVYRFLAGPLLLECPKILFYRDPNPLTAALKGHRRILI